MARHGSYCKANAGLVSPLAATAPPRSSRFESGLPCYSSENTSAKGTVVADVDHPRVAALLAPDRAALGRLIRKEG